MVFESRKFRFMAILVSLIAVYVIGFEYYPASSNIVYECGVPTGITSVILVPLWFLLNGLICNSILGVLINIPYLAGVSWFLSDKKAVKRVFNPTKGKVLATLLLALPMYLAGIIAQGELNGVFANAQVINWEYAVLTWIATMLGPILVLPTTYTIISITGFLLDKVYNVRESEELRNSIWSIKNVHKLTILMPLLALGALYGSNVTQIAGFFVIVVSFLYIAISLHKRYRSAKFTVINLVTSIAISLLLVEAFSSNWSSMNGMVSNSYIFPFYLSSQGDLASINITDFLNPLTNTIALSGILLTLNSGLLYRLTRKIQSITS